MKEKLEFVKLIEDLELTVKMENIPLTPMGYEFLMGQDDEFLKQYYEELRSYVG